MQLGHEAGFAASHVTVLSTCRRSRLDSGVLCPNRGPCDRALHGRRHLARTRGRRPGKQIVTDRDAQWPQRGADRGCGARDLAREVRRLGIDDGISWGETIELPDPVLGEQIALSPNGRRIAYGSLQHGLEVWEVEPFKRAITGSTTSLERRRSRHRLSRRAHVVVGGNGTARHRSSSGPNSRSRRRHRRTIRGPSARRCRRRCRSRGNKRS